MGNLKDEKEEREDDLGEEDDTNLRNSIKWLLGT